MSQKTTHKKNYEEVHVVLLIDHKQLDKAFEKEMGKGAFAPGHPLEDKIRNQFHWLTDSGITIKEVNND